MLMMTLVGSIIVFSNCNLFLVFHVSISIVIVSVKTSFLVFGDRDKTEIVNIYFRGMMPFCGKFLQYFLGMISDFFVSSAVDEKVNDILFLSRNFNLGF